MTERVFISYTKADKAKANKICQGLEARGLQCWIAPRDIPPGATDWAKPIVQAIRSASTLVLVLSNATSSSKDVHREIEIADEEELRIIPIEIEQVSNISEELRFRIGARQRIEAFEGQFDHHIDQLAETLTHEPVVPPPTPPWWDYLREIFTVRRPLVAAGVAAMLVGAVALAVLFGPANDEFVGPSLPDGKVAIEGKQFIESSILVELMAIMIEEEGGKDIDVQRTHWIGDNQLLFRNLVDGRSDLVPDYTGTLLVQYLKLPLDDIRKGDHKDDSWVRAKLEKSDHGQVLEWLDGFGFYSNYHIVMLEELAKDLGLQNASARPDAARRPTISDLARVARERALANRPLTLGFEPTFAENKRLDGYAGLLDAYPGLDKLEPEIVIHERKFIELTAKEIDVTNAFTLDPELVGPDIVELQDDRHFFTEYYAAPLARRDTLVAYPEVRRALEKLSGQISIDDMKMLIRKVDSEEINGKDLNRDDAVRGRLISLCRDFLEDKGLLKPRVAQPDTPVWTLQQTLFIGKDIPLSWTYQQSRIDASIDQSKRQISICFEIQRAVDKQFATGSDVETVAKCHATNKERMDRINGTRHYRVRALDSQKLTPVSNWSSTIELTQFRNVYNRIKATEELRVYMSDAQVQDIFKFDEGQGIKGVDIELARYMQRQLGEQMQRNLELRMTPVKWHQLLPSVPKGEADFVIATMTKTPEREKKYRITFSDPYFCTTYALIYLADPAAQPGEIQKMIAGKVVGAQRATTNSRLAIALLEDGASFKLENHFPTTENLMQALKDSLIEYAIIDTAFARGAQLDERADGVELLEYTEFKREDMPDSMRNKLKQEYGIPVRRSEKHLLDRINDAIARAKENGTLASIYEKASEEFEDARGKPRGSRRLTERPWECGRNNNLEGKLVAE